MIGVLGFTTPWLLLGLIILPLLWLVLRAVPPAPLRRRFPAVTLLLGLSADEVQTDRTPWWLLLMRAVMIAALVIGFAGPVLSPQSQNDTRGPLLIVMDGGWADASDWMMRIDHAQSVIDAAGRAGRPVAFAQLTRMIAAPEFQPAHIASQQVAVAQPDAWLPQVDVALFQDLPIGTQTYWLAGAVGFDGQSDLSEIFIKQGALSVYETGASTVALRPVTRTDTGLEITLIRPQAGPAQEVIAQLVGADPNGAERVLHRVTVEIATGDKITTKDVEIPPEIRNRITRITLAAVPHAGGVTLAGDRLKRPEIALLSGNTPRQEGLALLSSDHYLRQALIPSADLIEGTMADVLQANPDTIILTDVADIPDTDAVQAWVMEGGLLVRFAGPRLAAAATDRLVDDPLMPVRLRAGGRVVGGAMSWGAPKNLQSFPPDSPFYGLATPDEVTIRAQVLAEPGPDLAARVIARLDDGTPLVTRRIIGQGQVVLFHVTANADWSNLQLSGLFVAMLERLSVVADTSGADGEELADTSWQLARALDGYGALRTPDEPVLLKGADVVQATLSPLAPPGMYQGGTRGYARNVIASDAKLLPASWPLDVRRVGPEQAGEIPLIGWVLLAALGLAALDLIATLWLSGKLRGPLAGVMQGLFVLALALPQTADAQGIDDNAIAATAEVVLAYVITGDAGQDQISKAGLTGLSQTLFQRTAIEPAAPAGVDLTRDELAFYPFLYWPIIPDQLVPSDDTRAKLNRYLKGGGMILFDTLDGDVAGFGATTPQGRHLQKIAAGLEIPPLAPIPTDHVLTRSFYLLQDFPGRSVGQPIWVESATKQANTDTSIPFRSLNDGVTPVVIGGNDWAGAWAVNDTGAPLLPVGRGFAGDRQREIARRFGVNLIMHVLTGNYKSDQVHVPALLDRLGQ